MTIGQKIYELRTARNLSQGELADQLDVSRQSVSKWECDSAVPDLDKLIKLCDIFEVTLDELVNRENESTRKEETPPPSPTMLPSAFTTQKIVGYILLAVSLPGGILLSVFVDLLAGMISVPMLICAIICLTVKRRAGYWCVLVVWFFFEHLFSVPLLNISEAGILIVGAAVLRVILYISLFLITMHAFKDAPLPSRRNGVLLIVAWIVYLVLHALPLSASLLVSTVFELLILIVLSSIVPVLATPFLFIYTARYRSSKKQTEGKN